MKNHNVFVGIFVALGLIIFTLGLFLIGSQHQLFAKHTEYYTDFINISGIAKGSKVQVSGMDAGEVLEILTPGSPSSKFRIRFRIDSALSGLVRTDSVTTIETQGVVGDTILFVHPGSGQAAEVAPLSTVPSKEPVELADLLEKGQGLLKDADGAIRDVDGTIRSVTPKMNDALGTVNSAVANVNDVVVGIKQGRGPAGMLLRDEALSGQIRRIVANAQTATNGINDITAKADDMVTDLENRQLPKKIDDTMDSVKSTTGNLDDTSRQVRDTVAEMTAPDAQGVTAGANLRQTLTKHHGRDGQPCR